MHVHSRLSCCLSDIHSDVEPIGSMLGTRQPVGAAKKLENRDLLLRRHLEEVGDVTLRHHDDMTTTQRMVVQADIGQLILG